MLPKKSIVTHACAVDVAPVWHAAVSFATQTLEPGVAGAHRRAPDYRATAHAFSAMLEPVLVLVRTGSGPSRHEEMGCSEAGRTDAANVHVH